MTGRRIVYVLALVGSLIFYIIYQEWFSWIFLLTVLFFPWLSLLLSLGAMIRLKVMPEAPSRIPMGCDEKVSLTVSSPLPLPPYKSKLRITNPLTGERFTVKSGAALPTEHCGKLHIKPHKPRVFDFLGLFRLKVRRTTEKTVLVLPKPVETEIPSDLTSRLAPQWRKKPGGGFSENYEIRQYQPGDSLNQIHWKLSAKVDELMLREPMEPIRGLMLLTMDLRGTAAELDRKLGQLLWLGRYLLEQEISFDIRVLTAKGIANWTVQNTDALEQCIAALLDTPPATEGSIRDKFFKATWRYHIGGEQNEA